MNFSKSLFRTVALAGVLLTGCATHQPHPRKYVRDIPKTQKIYIVKKNDTLYGIGVRSGIAYQTLGRWNRIRSPYKIDVGQKIKLFNPVVKKRSKKAAIVASGKPKKTRDRSQNNYQKSKKTRIESQKKPTFSDDKQKVLKFNCQWPIRGEILKSFSKTGNKGIDISGKPGQAVKAASSGKVVYSGHGLAGYGNLVIIKHNEKFLSAYANNRRLYVKEGQRVRMGQKIAELGMVRGKQPSLHFEIREKGKPVNPLRFLQK